jgi:Protein of unknown function (DUF2806)
MSAWLSLIKSIPGAAKAVAELVGDASHLGSAAAKLGSAKIDQARHAIEDQSNRDSAISQALTESEVAITKAIGRASVEYIDANSHAIGERALAHGIHRLVKQQHNREMVVLKTIENLQISPPETAPQAIPSEDWLNLFGRYAENASSEKMREHWAHILEGEIRKPGSFSFITLHLASVLDEGLARIIESFRPWILDREIIPLIEPIAAGVRYNELVTLAAIGFVSIANHSSYFEPPNDGSKPIEIRLEAGTIFVPARAKTKIGNVEFPSKEGLFIRAAIITPAGVELLSALSPVKQDRDLPRILMAYLDEEGYKEVSFEPKSEGDSAKDQ